ncbi:hypothetical protein BKA70DRAFT_885806 [Coprinopsis sp. MPI-PUGE-AT-0042]|nr:hypothetical protein BKA70DRAFT_885806 [Coprinopsis sp. MPI-PUGE-AT-0042]
MIHPEGWPYGHTAKIIGTPWHLSPVGQAPKSLAPGTNSRVPWHRDIGSFGAIFSPGPGTKSG